MNFPAVIRKLRDLESEVSAVRQWVEEEHQQSWPETLNRVFGAETKSDQVELDDIFGPDLEAGYVEQVELFLEEGIYKVQLRFDDDSEELLGTFQLYSTAYEFAREQARRYHIAIFDSTYEELVD